MKILVVDDEDMLIEFLQRSLKADGHSVDIANDGLEAYKKACQNRYDAIILDVIMPIKNGIDVCGDLRSAGVKTPVLMLSSRNTEEARVQGLDSGADDYMTKPFGYSELSARLRALERRVKNRPIEPIYIHDLVIDQARRRVTRNGVQVSLRPKEYSLLVCLAQNKGQAVSKSHLLHKVWGVSVPNASTRLQVCVKSLREKLGATDKNPVIENVRGYGYLIEGPKK